MHKLTSVRLEQLTPAANEYVQSLLRFIHFMDLLRAKGPSNPPLKPPHI